MISSLQIKAARALLDWSQDDLAEGTGLSRTTIRSIELGYAARPGNIKEIYRILEANGVEFLEGDGVRLRPQDKRDFMGSDSCDRFFEYMMRTVKRSGGDVVCQFESQAMLTKVSGKTHSSNLQRLEVINRIVPVQCMLGDTMTATFVLPSYGLRFSPEKPTILSMSTFVFGQQLALAYMDNNQHFSFAVFHNEKFVTDFRNYFQAKWGEAKPVVQISRSKKACA